MRIRARIYPSRARILTHGDRYTFQEITAPSASWPKLTVVTMMQKLVSFQQLMVVDMADWPNMWISRLLFANMIIESSDDWFYVVDVMDTCVTVAWLDCRGSKRVVTATRAERRALTDLDAISAHRYTMELEIGDDGQPLIMFESLESLSLLAYTCAFTLDRLSIELMKKICRIKCPDVKSVGSLSLRDLATHLFAAAGHDYPAMRLALEARQRKLDESAAVRKRKREAEGWVPGEAEEAEGQDNDEMGAVIAATGQVVEECDDQIDAPAILQQLCPLEVLYVKGQLPGGAALQEEETDEGVEKVAQEDKKRRSQRRATPPAPPAAPPPLGTPTPPSTPVYSPESPAPTSPGHQSRHGSPPPRGPSPASPGIPSSDHHPSPISPQDIVPIPAPVVIPRPASRLEGYFVLISSEALTYR